MKKNTILRVLAAVLVMLTLSVTLLACSGGSEDDYYFETKGGVKVAIGADEEDVLDELGNPLSETSSASCGGFEGKDYVYTYKGFRVSTTPAKNGQVVCKIELTDDSVKTPEGLYIGMSREDAEEAMKGKKSDSTGGNLVYSSETTKLQVIIRDDSVAGIVYVAK